MFNHMDKGDTKKVDVTVGDAKVNDFDALVLPGGVANPDALRLDADAVSLVRDFVASGRPVAAICHAPWSLIEADVLKGRRLTSWPSLQTDIRNAGGEWVDEEVRHRRQPHHQPQPRRPARLLQRGGRGAGSRLRIYGVRPRRSSHEAGPVTVWRSVLGVVCAETCAVTA